MPGQNDYDPKLIEQMLKNLQMQQDAQRQQQIPQEPVEKPAIQYWQDYLGLALLALVLVDYLVRQLYKRFYGESKNVKARTSDPLINLNNMKFEESTGKRKKDSPKRRRGKKDKFGLSTRKSQDEEDLKKELEQNKAPKGVNAYDLLKAYGVFMTMVDHYGYFGVPGISYDTSRWTRAWGRSAAAPFFFLAGYSNNYRFRWRTWCFAALMWLANAFLWLRLTYTSWDSMNTILCINFLFAYVKPDKTKNIFVHALFLGSSMYFKNFFGKTCRMAYGTMPYNIAIGAYLVKRGCWLGKVWLAVSMLQFGYVANSVFTTGTPMTIFLICLLTVLTLVFMFFDKFAKKGEFRVFDRVPLVKKAILYLSRNGMYVYLMHLMFFRLIQITKHRW